jgi:hypothetical protein
MNRVLQAARLHVVHPLFILGMPWVIVLSSFTINELIWGFGNLGHQPGNTGGTGGVLALYISVSIVFLQSVTQLFPFSMSLGLSRRLFSAGTAVMAVAQAVGYAVVLTVLTALEDASGGWWTGMHFFAPLHIDRLPVAEQFAVFFCLMLGFALLGIAIGAVHKRWGAAGLYGLFIGAVLGFGGAAVVITALGAWSEFGGWFVDTPALALSAIYLGFAALLGAGLAWTGLRRAVP